VFDMDGVLLDSEPFWRAVETEVFAGLGIEVTEADLMRTMGVRVADVVAMWHERHPWTEPSREEVVEEIVQGVVDRIGREGVLNEGVEDAIDYFRGHGLRLALASSSPMRMIRGVLAHVGLADRFEVVRTAEDEAHGKPDPAVYRSAARDLGVPPERSLAIEDSVAGVRSAKSAGMVCVAYATTDPVLEDLDEADLVIHSLTELDDRLWAATDTEPVALS